MTLDNIGISPTLFTWIHDQALHRRVTFMFRSGSPVVLLLLSDRSPALSTVPLPGPGVFDGGTLETGAWAGVAGGGRPVVCGGRTPLVTGFVLVFGAPIVGLSVASAFG